MDTLVVLLVQATVRIVMALTQLAMMAAMLLGQGMAWLLVALWRGWQRRRYRRLP